VHLDVVEISSSEDEEDSDLIMVPSDAELDEDEAGDDEDDDVENSGSHVNDALNQRDAMGGVLVNVGHPDAEKDIFLAPQLAGVVKPHQVNTPIVRRYGLIESTLVEQGLTSHSTQFRSFLIRCFYRSDDPTNNVNALKEGG